MEVIWRFKVGLDKKDIQLILRQYISYFITYEKPPGIYSIKDISEGLSRVFQSEFEIRGGIRPNLKNVKFNSIVVESDNITTRTKLIVRPDIIALRFDEKSFFSTT